MEPAILTGSGVRDVSGHSCKAWCTGDVHCTVMYTPTKWPFRPQRFVKSGQGWVTVVKVEPASRECEPALGRPRGYDYAWLVWWRPEVP